MPALIVHTREDVARVRDISPAPSLITPPNAACYLGVGYMLEMQRALAPTALLVGCGNDAATAHEALQAGVKRVYAAVAPEMQQKLEAIAAQMQAVFTADYPLDAVDIGSVSSLEHVRSFLQGVQHGVDA